MTDARAGVAERLPRQLIAAVPLAVAALLTVLAWPVPNNPARATLDGSWQIALHLGAQLGLQHGVDIVFTYGPLGFLGFPHPYVGATSGLALAVTIAIYLGLIATMLVEARRIMPTWAAIVVTLLVARIFVALPPFESFQALAFVWCVEVLADRVRLPVPAIAAVAGVLAGAAILGKVNIGIFVFLMGAVTMAWAGRPWWRGLAVYLAVVAATAAGLWLVTGQHLANVGAYAVGVYQIISGYNDAMGTDPSPKRTWIFLALAVVAAILAWTGWGSSRAWPRRQRVGLAALAIVFAFAMWKTAVVREHAIFVFASALVAMFAFAPRVERRNDRLVDRQIWLIGLLAVGIAFAGSSFVEPRSYLDVVGSARSLAGEAADAFVPGRGAAAAQRTRDDLRAWYVLDPSTLAAIGDHTVSFDPFMTSAAFAYPDLHWAPLPVFQSYSAYTPALDGRNADLLRSSAAPERILRNFDASATTDLLRLWIGRAIRPGEVFPVTVDGRFRWFEAPDATLETFCRYVQTAVTDRWQVLARTGRSCGPPEPLGTISAKAGDTVTVPIETRPDRFVIVKVGGLEPSLPGRLRSLLYKGHDWYVELDDTRYRLVAATASDGLLLAVPPVADGSGPFSFGAPIRTMVVKEGQSGHESKAPLTFEFLSVPLAQP